MRKLMYIWFESLILGIIPPPSPRWRGLGGGIVLPRKNWSFSLSRTCFILALVSIFSISPKLSAQNAEIDRSPNLSQLEASFLATPFSPQQFEAFSARGEQKFRDFLEYVSFLSSEEVEPLWKAHIADQVKALFITETVPFLNEESLITFLKKPTIIAGDESVLEMEIIQPFEKKDEHFVAVLETKITHKNGKQERILADLHLLKQEKQFGKESISVWKVLLGALKRE